MGAGADNDWSDYGKTVKTTLLNLGVAGKMDASTMLPGSGRKRRGAVAPQQIAVGCGAVLFLLLLVWMLSGGSGPELAHDLQSTNGNPTPLKHMNDHREAQILRAKAEQKRRMAMHNAAAKQTNEAKKKGGWGFSQQQRDDIAKNARDQAAAYNAAFQRQHEKMQQQNQQPSTPPTGFLARQLKDGRADIREKTARQLQMQKQKAQQMQQAQAQMASRVAKKLAASTPPAPPSIPAAPVQ